ncbi:hypothetical protein PIB30_023945 [Stylosanthes scabra]|uniref:Aminotransferase-like plant mobile domain-containing protein n=1 Tax=Stylosanthes scabra TaxID=79078 RepID=A0ABU6WD45_9FABA|nr:hypothetical protein [Stylosanthes scabra]
MPTEATLVFSMGVALPSKLKCPFASDVWNQSKFPSITSADSFTDFWKWWLTMVDALKRGTQWHKQANLVTAALWRLWNNRNLCIFEGVSGSSISILTAAYDLMQEYHLYHPP